MTKYKTNAQKLKFFNDAKAARMPKARWGQIVKRPTFPGEIYDPNPNEPTPHSPDTMYTNTTAGELDKLRSFYNAPSDVINRLEEFKNRPRKKGGSVKRKKRK